MAFAMKTAQGIIITLIHWLMLAGIPSILQDVWIIPGDFFKNI